MSILHSLDLFERDVVGKSDSGNGCGEIVPSSAVVDGDGQDVRAEEGRF